MLNRKIFTGIIATSFCLSATAQNEKPNIVFILADDLGWTDLSCTGSDFYETPHIDKLRSTGMLFTQTYTNAALGAFADKHPYRFVHAATRSLHR